MDYCMFCLWNVLCIPCFVFKSIPKYIRVYTNFEVIKPVWETTVLDIVANTPMLLLCGYILYTMRWLLKCMLFTLRILVKWMQKEADLKLMIRLLEIQVDNIELYIKQDRYQDTGFGHAQRSKVNDDVKAYTETKAEVEKKSSEYQWNFN